jgi:hypothetical protein
MTIVHDSEAVRRARSLRAGRGVASSRIRSTRPGVHRPAFFGRPEDLAGAAVSLWDHAPVIFMVALKTEWTLSSHRRADEATRTSNMDRDVDEIVATFTQRLRAGRAVPPNTWQHRRWRRRPARILRLS